MSRILQIPAETPKFSSMKIQGCERPVYIPKTDLIPPSARLIPLCTHAALLIIPVHTLHVLCCSSRSSIRSTACSCDTTVETRYPSNPASPQAQTSIRINCSIDSIRIVNHLSTPPASTAHPHTSIKESVAIVSSLQLHGDAEFVLIRCYRVGGGGISELLHDVSGASAPAERFDGDVCWWLVLGLEEVVGVDARGEVAEDELGVLTARLVEC